MYFSDQIIGVEARWRPPQFELVVDAHPSVVIDESQTGIDDSRLARPQEGLPYPPDSTIQTATADRRKRLRAFSWPLVTVRMSLAR